MSEGVTIEVIQGQGGVCLSMNDRRISGVKAFGAILCSFTLDPEALKNEVDAATDGELATLRAEVESLRRRVLELEGELQQERENNGIKKI